MYTIVDRINRKLLYKNYNTDLLPRIRTRFNLQLPHFISEENIRLIEKRLNLWNYTWPYMPE